MYYISPAETNPSISRIVKRLKDFKGEEGKDYHVRKKAKIDYLDAIPHYTVKAGKLTRCPQKTYSIFRLFG
jgi:hypothetical protein